MTTWKRKAGAYRAYCGRRQARVTVESGVVVLKIRDGSGAWGEVKKSGGWASIEQAKGGAELWFREGGVC